MNTKRGFVTLVGAGPGDPELLTLAAVRALAAAEVVLYDALLSPTVLKHCREEAEHIAVGKRAGAHSMSQDAINGLMIAKAREGRRVVRLKGGDPFVFGRGGEEALACQQAGIAFAVVPGVTSAVAVPAYAGIPLTQRGMARNFAVVTGSETGEDSVDWAAIARMDTIVVLMGGGALAEVSRKLIAAGRDTGTPAASISDGTLATQRSTLATLGTIAETVKRDGLATPLITVIGEVARLHETLAWRTAGPLAGKSVVVTRTRTQASTLSVLLEALGARVVEAPVLEIRPTAVKLVGAEGTRSHWDWVVFTSQNAVDAFFTALRSANRDARALGTARVAVIGAATAAAAERYGLLADFSPSMATGEALADELPLPRGARILVPSGSLSEPGLCSTLRARGAEVEQLTVYETLPARLDAALLREVLAADAVTFASASSARFLREALGSAELPAQVALCAIGARAAEATRAAFGRVDAVAAEPSIEGLVSAVVEVLP